MFGSGLPMPVGPFLGDFLADVLADVLGDCCEWVRQQARRWAGLPDDSSIRGLVTIPRPGEGIGVVETMASAASATARVASRPTPQGRTINPAAA